MHGTGPATRTTTTARRSRAAAILVAVPLLLACLAATPAIATAARASSVFSGDLRPPVIAQTAAMRRTPSLVAPDGGAVVQGAPVFQWSAVAGAAKYEFQLAADDSFGSIVSKGAFQTLNTFASITSTLADGTYYWRVRAINAKEEAGPWSSTRTLRKSWSTAPALLGPPTDAPISYPTVPLVLRWSPVEGAFKYLVSIGTDPTLASAKPVETSGTVFSPTGSLAPGRYYWAVQPEDADKHKGAMSAVGSFIWSWPTTTATRINDLNDDTRVFDPQFSWDPVPGAARYEVEVNSAVSFPLGSKWCCSDLTTGTSLSPTDVLANNRYYWRVRAFDSDGNAGEWNYGPSFDKTFDAVVPSIPNLHLRDTSGNVVDGTPTTDTPIVTWDPVPGASRYEVSLGTYTSDGPGQDPYCHFGGSIATGSTAWTPLASAGHIGPSAWPGPQTGSSLAPGATYCVRVLAGSDNDGKGGQVISQYTQLNGTGNPAFTYAAQPAAGTPGVTPGSAYKLPADTSTTPRTPLFTWDRVPNAAGYYVVIARDSGFTRIADIGYTEIPAYAPRFRSESDGVDEPLSDETTAYYWAVIPRGAGGVPNDDPNAMSPKTFNKSSLPPSLLSPAEGSDVWTQPTFRWTSAENAKDYRLEVSQDPTFGNPINDVTTDSTAFTSSSTYPADTVLYWRVRANDWNGVQLNWSATGTFRRRLAIPVLSPDNPLGGGTIPVLTWAPIEGATSYDFHADQADGTGKDFNVRGTALTPTTFYGTGVWHWKVRARFAQASSGDTAGAYSGLAPYTRNIDAPTNPNAINAPHHVLLRWDPSNEAKQYRVQVSATNSFSSTIDSVTTDNTSYAPTLSGSGYGNGGLLYWRVAVVDEGGNVGAYATRELRTLAALKVSLSGSAKRRLRTRVTVTVKTVKGSAVKSAKVTVRGAGVKRVSKRTGKKGTATFSLRPRRRGTITFSVARGGYQPTDAALTVR